MLEYEIDTPKLRNCLIKRQDDIVELCIEASITDLYICAPSRRNETSQLNLLAKAGSMYSFEKKYNFISEMKKILEEEDVYIPDFKQENVVIMRSYETIELLIKTHTGYTADRLKPIISSAIPILELRSESINKQLQDRLKESMNIELEQSSIITSVSSSSNEENSIPSHVDNLNKRRKTNSPQVIQEKPEIQDDASDLKHIKSFKETIENPNQNPQNTR